MELGSYVLDTLQIYFPWDDDLYTELKKHGFGKGNSKVLPLVYSDNTEATIGQDSKRRKFVIRPELFGKTYEALGWSETERRAEPIIPAEKPLAHFSLVKENEETAIKMSIQPCVNNEEQYHLEYSCTSLWGHKNVNWATFYFMPSDFLSLLDRARQALGIRAHSCGEIAIFNEPRQRQREQMRFVKIPVYYYQFCLKGFRYAMDFFNQNGVPSTHIPCLAYNSTDQDIHNMMLPYLKVGVVHTAEEAGFDLRKPQVALKVAQDRTTVSRRGMETKKKGKLVYGAGSDNYLLVDANHFIPKSEVIIKDFHDKAIQKTLF